MSSTMAATSFLPANPRLTQRRRIATEAGRNNGLVAKRVAIKSQHEGEGDGKSVDEGMIVLRMRIKKLKVIESGGGGGEGALPPAPPSEWKEWEKRVFTHYHESVCDSVEMVQSYLMNTRPSVAVGVAALVAMSVPLSTSVVAANFLKLAKGLLAGCHVCIDIDF